MKKLLGCVLCLCMVAALFAAPAMAAGMKPGTYTAKGMYNGLTVEVTVSEDAIEAIEVTAYQETAPGWPALEKVPEAIIEAQSTAVDGVSGAT